MKNRVGLLTIAVLAALAFIGANAVAARPEHTLKVGRKDYVTFTKETRVGDVTLKPGWYLMQHRGEGDNHFMSFTEVTKPYFYYGLRAGRDPMAPPVDVKCKLQTLSTKADATRILTTSEGDVDKLTSIEIAGENVAHVF